MVVIIILKQVVFICQDHFLLKPGSIWGPDIISPRDSVCFWSLGSRGDRVPRAPSFLGRAKRSNPLLPLLQAAKTLLGSLLLLFLLHLLRKREWLGGPGRNGYHIEDCYSAI